MHDAWRRCHLHSNPMATSSSSEFRIFRFFRIAISTNRIGFLKSFFAQDLKLASLYNPWKFQVKTKITVDTRARVCCPSNGHFSVLLGLNIWVKVRVRSETSKAFEVNLVVLKCVLHLELALNRKVLLKLLLTKYFQDLFWIAKSLQVAWGWAAIAKKCQRKRKAR